MRQKIPLCLGWQRAAGDEDIGTLRAGPARCADRGISQRAAAERFGINALTVCKMLKFSAPPGSVRRKRPFSPKLAEYMGIIDEVERAPHIAFAPNRVNAKREFFKIDPAQVGKAM